MVNVKYSCTRSNNHKKIFIRPRVITRGIEKMHCAELKIVSYVFENSMIDFVYSFYIGCAYAPAAAIGQAIMKLINDE